MDNLQKVQDELRKDEAMEREIEGTRQQLVKELQGYISRKEVFESVTELRSVNQKIADVEVRIAENLSEKESISTRIKQKKVRVAEVIKKQFETQEGPAIIHQVHTIFLDAMKHASTGLAGLEHRYTDMVTQNDKLQARSMELFNKRNLKGDLWVRTVGNLIGHWRHNFGLADSEEKR